MSIRITIDAACREDAELIAAALPGGAEAASWRGYGVIRLDAPGPDRVRELLPLVEACVERHRLPWARVRVGDDEHMFRARHSRMA